MPWKILLQYTILQKYTTMQDLHRLAQHAVLSLEEFCFFIKQSEKRWVAFTFLSRPMLAKKEEQNA